MKSPVMKAREASLPEIRDTCIKYSAVNMILMYYSCLCAIIRLEFMFLI